MKIFDNFYHQFMKKSENTEGVSGQDGSAVVLEDIYFEVEDLLCFERAIRFCYASLEMMIHNRSIRHQCQNFAKWSLTNEGELEGILAESFSDDIKIKKEYQPYTLPNEDLNVEAVLSLGLVLSEYRLSIYQEMRKHLPTKNRILLNHIISHIEEEIKFFNREKEFLQVEGILYSLN
ncbi:MAG: hypothetical protein HQL15_10925 [Candidatus Omnitrophica bacterium]|nr:hypothetical protein [Candidatus Omnitrophota bacterium]